MAFTSEEALRTLVLQGGLRRFLCGEHVPLLSVSRRTFAAMGDELQIASTAPTRDLVPAPETMPAVIDTCEICGAETEVFEDWTESVAPDGIPMLTLNIVCGECILDNDDETLVLGAPSPIRIDICQGCGLIEETNWIYMYDEH